MRVGGSKRDWLSRSTFEFPRNAFIFRTLSPFGGCCGWASRAPISFVILLALGCFADESSRVYQNHLTPLKNPNPSSPITRITSTYPGDGPLRSAGHCRRTRSRLARPGLAFFV